VLGRGSYGTAVLARMHGKGDGTDGRPESANAALCVVKEVDLARASDKCRSEALKEAELLKSLAHPNIIGYADAFLMEMHLCIAMEFADAGDLWAAIQRRRSCGRRYLERDAMSIFVQVVLALEYLHGRRIMHRDMKSQNVFLTSAGVVKLGDFGIAKVLEDSETCAETRVGTPHNLPPEICESRPYDFKADIWGLGVLLYEILALEVPFSGTSVAGLVVRICTAEPKAIPSVYSSELRVLSSRLLAKKAEERPSAAEVASLSHVQRGLAAMRPMTPNVAGPADEPAVPSLHIVPATTLKPEAVVQVVRIPTPMGRVKANVHDEEETESPKRARLTLPVQPARTPSSQTNSGRVSNAELREARRILGGDRFEFDCDPCSPASFGCSPQAMRPASADATTADERSPWRTIFGERSPGGPIEMSATCSALLCELEQELQDSEQM